MLSISCKNKEVVKRKVDSEYTVMKARTQILVGICSINQNPV